jgi:hypothetical protein
MRKFPGHIAVIKALGRILCNEHPTNLYKIEIVKESNKWSINSLIYNIGFFT